jgi:hypothetical protein
MSDQIKKEEEAKKILESTTQADELENLEEMLKNNIIEWSVEGNTYRVRKPTYTERQEVREIKLKRNTELLRDDRYLYEKQLIELYEKKGISIAKMIEQQLKLEEKVNEVELKLAELGNIKESESQKVIDLKMEIFNMKMEQRAISLEKMDLLSYSIENELLSLINSYICYLCLEKKIENNWIRAFNTYESFMDSKSDDLLNKTAHYMSLIIYNEK